MRKLRKSLFFGLLGIVTAVSFFLAFSFVDAQQVKTQDRPPGKGKPPDKDKGKTTPLIELQSGHIVTTESDYILNVWGDSTEYPEWSTETPGYSSIAVGDVYKDDSIEIIGPEVKRYGGGHSIRYEFFLNIYEQGAEEVPSHSTRKYASIEDTSFLVEIITFDIDGDPDDEVILRTSHKVAVFDYNIEKEEFDIVSSTSTNELSDELSEISLGSDPHFTSVAAGDVLDGDNVKEILVSSYCWDGVESEYVLVLNEKLGFPGEYLFPDSNCYKDYYDTGLGFDSLRTADLDGDGDLEICSTVESSSEDNEKWWAFVIVWDDDNGWEGTSKLIPNCDSMNEYPFAILDTGQLDDDSPEEIVVSTRYYTSNGLNKFQLSIANYNSGLSYGPSLKLKLGTSINDVGIGDVANDYIYDEIIAGGDTENRNYYLKVFDSTFDPIKSFGVGKENIVRDMAVVK